MNETQIWQFYYHRGSAGLTGYVRASNEMLALKVATAWCEQMGARYRAPASVTPFILADESILINGERPVIGPDPIPDAVQATTAVNAPSMGERLKAALR